MRVGQLGGQNGQRTAFARFLHQGSQGLAAQQGNVAVKNENRSLPPAQGRETEADGMPGSLLFCLLDHGHSALTVASHERLLHLGALVTEHGHDGRGVQFQRPLDWI